MGGCKKQLVRVSVFLFFLRVWSLDFPPEDIFLCVASSSSARCGSCNLRGLLGPHEQKHTADVTNDSAYAHLETMFRNQQCSLAFVLLSQLISALQWQTMELRTIGCEGGVDHAFQSSLWYLYCLNMLYTGSSSSKVVKSHNCCFSMYTKVQFSACLGRGKLPSASDVVFCTLTYPGVGARNYSCGAKMGIGSYVQKQG